jgi:RHS repeat-associated protein
VLVSRSNFDVWGVRTVTQGTADDRGFTGHEHISFGLIHMNGRVYDPVWGRFLQSDPIIQSPYDLQSYIRYSYVMNNPLSFTDPTGFSRWTNFRNRYGKAILAIAAAFFIQPVVANWATWGLADAGIAMGSEIAIGNVVGSAAAGFASGGIMGGNLNSALKGAVTGGILGMAGQFAPAGTAGSYAAHAAAGCANSMIGGGKCGAGAVSGVVGKLFTNVSDSWGPGPAQFAGTVIGGGVASRVGGGSFESGAFSAAMGYLFNHMSGCQLARMTVKGLA